MLGHAREIEKNMLFALDWDGPWRRAVKVKKGKVSTLVTVDGGERVELHNLTAVRFVTPGLDPQPASLSADYERPAPRKQGDTRE